MRALPDMRRTVRFASGLFRFDTDGLAFELPAQTRRGFAIAEVGRQHFEAFRLLAQRARCDGAMVS